MSFNVQRALEAGKSKEEIAVYLSSNAKINMDKALKDGKTHDQIIEYLAPRVGRARGDNPSVPASVENNTSDNNAALEAWKRVPGRTLRAGTKGVGEAIDFIATPFRGALNYGNEFLGGAEDYFKPITPSIMKQYDEWGIAKPETDLEKVADTGASALASGGGFIKGAQTLGTLAKAGGKLAGVTDFLSANPYAQLISSGSGGSASEVAQQAGMGPGGQMVTGLLAGGLAPSIPNMLRNTGTRLGKSIINPEKANAFLRLGEQAPSIGTVSDSGLIQATEGGLTSLFPSAGVMKKAMHRGDDIIQRQVTKASEELAGGGMVPHSLEDMGVIANRGAMESKDAFTSTARNFENNVYKQLEQNTASLDNVLAMVDNNAARLSPSAGEAYRQRIYAELGPLLEDARPSLTLQGKPVPKDILQEAPYLAGKIQQSDPALNVATLRDFRGNVGAKMKAEPTANTAGANQGELKQLYGELAKDIEAALPPEGQQKVSQYNQWYATQKNMRDSVDKTFFGTRDSTATAKAILSADQSQLAELRAVVGDEAFNELRAGALRQISTGGTDAISSTVLSTKLGEGTRSMQPQVRDYLFGEHGKNLGDMARALNESKAFINRSNTANAAFLGGQGALLGVGLPTAPLSTAGTAVGLNMIARGMTNPRTINSLIRASERQVQGSPYANLPGLMGVLSNINE